MRRLINPPSQRRIHSLELQNRILKDQANDLFVALEKTINVLQTWYLCNHDTLEAESLPELWELYLENCPELKPYRDARALFEKKP
jgi:hypothetical protein